MSAPHFSPRRLVRALVRAFRRFKSNRLYISVKEIVLLFQLSNIKKEQDVVVIHQFQLSLNNEIRNNGYQSHALIFSYVVSYYWINIVIYGSM